MCEVLIGITRLLAVLHHKKQYIFDFHTKTFQKLTFSLLLSERERERERKRERERALGRVEQWFGAYIKVWAYIHTFLTKIRLQKRQMWCDVKYECLCAYVIDYKMNKLLWILTYNELEKEFNDIIRKVFYAK